MMVARGAVAKNEVTCNYLSMKKPTALLIQPPVYDFALYDLYLKPFGLLRLGSWLERGGYRIDFVNGLDYRNKETISVLGTVRRKSNGTGKFHRVRVPFPENIQGRERHFARYGMLEEIFRERITASDPDIILVTSGMTYWYRGVAEAVHTARKLHPGIPVAVGGVYATLMPEHCARVTGADYVVQGEGEPAIRGILQSHHLPVPENAVDDRLLMIESIWKDAGVLRLNYGCPYHCDYCASSVICGTFTAGRNNTAFNMLQEMNARFGTKNFAFYDDALLIDKEHTFIPFLRRVLDWGNDVRFYLPNAVHLQFLDREVSTLMKKAGFQEIRLGFESSSGEFHKKHDDKYSSGDFPSAVEHLKTAGFSSRNITVYILAGLPGQDYREVEESLRYAASFGVKVSLAEYSPVPGTPLWPESVRTSPFPLEAEPLYHNNTFFSMEWGGFTLENLKYLKALALSLNRTLTD